MLIFPPKQMPVFWRGISELSRNKWSPRVDSKTLGKLTAWQQIQLPCVYISIKTHLFASWIYRIYIYSLYIYIHYIIHTWHCFMLGYITLHCTTYVRLDYITYIHIHVTVTLHYVTFTITSPFRSMGAKGAKTKLISHSPSLKCIQLLCQLAGSHLQSE